MPHEIISLSETYHSTTRPVAISVIKDMLFNLGLNKDTAIIFPGYADQVPYNNTTTDQFTPNTPINEPTRQQAVITVTETNANHTAQSEDPRYLDAYPIFYDGNLGVTLKPIYNTKQMDIGIILRAKDATTVRRWYTHLKNMITQDYLTGAHLINYSYVIPEAIMLLLIEIHSKRESNAGYGDTLGKYITKHFTPRFVIDTNQAGLANTPLIREEQTMVHAWFDMDTTNPTIPNKNNNTGEWELELNYKFFYSKCEKLMIDYPIVIHNQQIDTRFINLNQVPPFERNYRDRTTDSRLPLKHFIAHRNYGPIEGINPGLPIPWYDEWTIPVALYNGYTEASYLRLLTLANLQNKTLVNLTQLGDISLTLSTIRFLKIRPIGLITLHDSIFTLRVFRNDQLLKMSKTLIDNNLNVGHEWDYQLRDQYRVTLNICTDPSVLSENALKDLCKDPCFTADYFYFITGTYKYLAKPKSCPIDPNDPNFNPDTDIPDEDKIDIGKIRWIISEIAKDRTLIAPPPYQKFFTVGTFDIISKRKE